ncbi:MAG: hypothetical protein LBL98_03725 [Ruminococcus sp.]|nr:hypothetical protein [Ruminococcus sp.]
MKKRFLSILLILIFTVSFPLTVNAEDEDLRICEITADYDDGVLLLSWVSTVEGGSFTLFVSDNGKNFSKLAETSDISYDYKDTFKKKYFKVTQKVGNETLESSILIVEKVTNGYPDIDYYDTDGDGFNDMEETIWTRTDKNKADTDSDGLTDFEEYYYTDTDPLVYDSAVKGVSDSTADPDKDGLSNRIEITKGADPTRADTDFDNLKDGDEVNKHKTDPKKPDTDGDKLSDGDEVSLKLDPLKTKSDGKTLDSERLFKQTIPADNEVLRYINDGEEIKYSVTITAAGVPKNNLTASESGYSNVMKQNTAILGMVPEFEYTDGLAVKTFKLGAKIPDSLVPNTIGTYAKDEEELIGIKRFNFFRYFEEINILLPVDTTFDVENNMVYTETTDLGTYCLMDLEIWFESLEAAL